jgi:hypothetical protein
MVLDILYFSLNTSMLPLVIIFFILKIKEFPLKRLKYFYIGFFILDIFILIANFEDFFSNYEELTFSISFSYFALTMSLAIFILSFLIVAKDLIILKRPSRYESRKGNILIGRVMKKERKLYKFFLSLKDLERHMFVCGSTGSGKSNFVQNFLIKFKKKYDIPILLAEFKGEYTFLQEIIEDLLVIRPGENFSINIFNPEGSNPQIHAERIFDILKSGQFLDDTAEFSPQMEKVLVDILTKVCNNPQYQSWNGFYQQCELYLDQQKTQIPMLHQSLVSIENRIRRFSLGPLKSIFATRYKLNILDLFDKNVLIDLSSIIRLGGEKEDALFFLNMVLKYLWDKNLTQGAFNFKGIQHITIVEDAQYFAPKDLTLQTKLTSYLEDIALLQRGTGECLISIATRPRVSEEILANCGVLISFKNHMQRSFLCELLNLKEKNEDYLSIVEEGQCIIRTNSVKRPFLLWVPYIKRHWINRGDVNRKNKLIFNKIKEEKIIEKEKLESETKLKTREKAPNDTKVSQNNDNPLLKAMEIKYFIDNLENIDENEIEDFNPENYRECPNCHSILNKREKICPFCANNE